MTTRQKKQTPTETIRTWIKDFVTKPNPVFGDLPPCPFAQKAIVDGKVEFLELDGIGEFGTIFTHIWDFDFDEKDVLVIIAEPDQYTAKETVEIAEKLNWAFMPRDVVVLEDHPDYREKIGNVDMSNGRYCLLFAQRRSKLNHFSDILRETTDYYKNWTQAELDDIVTWRHRDPK